MLTISGYLRSLNISLVDQPIYRGHASIAWTVECSAFRNGSAGITSAWDLGQWSQMARRFVDYGSSNPLRDLVLAQHYGIPTTLLDWTTNPLIALYFASESDPSKSDGKVIKMTAIPGQAENLSADELFEPRQYPLVFDTSTMNLRSTAQDSIMSLHSKGESPFNTHDVFVLPQGEKKAVRAALAMFGITAERVYADLGVAASQFRLNLEERATFNRVFEEVVSLQVASGPVVDPS
ncbi:FRG domain-containing protein [Sphingomonas sp. LH128]|uniref:FRG domain-containing protein n=1 Tax=Sphingomonas sp. LH128 TaxID=473781 RepID=UPI0002F6AD09|nr:FRG domain-containing protein [Sphingomonas sp. LH128]